MANKRRHPLLRSAAAAACILSVAVMPAWAYDWLQFGGNPQHSGNNAAETILSPANVSTLVQKYQASLPAIADGAPVYLEAVTTPGGVKNLLFVTTRDGRIIALDAQTGATAWSHQYGPNGCKINNGSSDCYTTSSPAIDPNRLYVYGYGLDGNVHKYQVGDGTEISTGGWPQNTTLKGFDEKGSSALSTATSAGTTYLYVTHGGYPGDNGDYQGHVTAINLATGAQKVFNAACSDLSVHLHHFGGGVEPTCPTKQNAIWSRPGVIYDAGTDRIFMGTGNSFNGFPGQFDGNHNWSESVIALHPDGSGGAGAIAGKPLDSYTPTNHASLDSADADVGSTAPAILPVPPSSKVQHLAVQSGKDATLRLLNLQDLSGQGGPGNVGGEIGAIINVPQGGVVLSQPAVWVNPADNSTWIFVVNGNGASGVRLNFDGAGNPSLSAQWHNGQSGTSPVVANNMVFLIGGSSVRALDPLSGSQLWSAARGGSTHWQSVIVANGVVYATDQANHLAAFGLPQNLAPSSTALSTSANPGNGGQTVTLTATVIATTPTGTVAFTEAGTALPGCSAVAVSGTAAVCTAAVSVGTHSLVATYSGNASTFGSTSPPLLQKILPIGMANVALASAGASTAASSTYSVGYPASAINNDERAGVSWGSGSGGWNDGTNGAFPDWVEITFNGNKIIDRVIVYTVQDNYTSPIEPTDTTTFSLYGLTDFTIDAWNGTAWITVGTVTGNNLVKRKIKLAAPFTTSKIRINVSNGLVGYSRITEVEAYGTNTSGPAAVVNNDFEIPTVGSGYQYTPSAQSAGWTFSPGSGIQGNGSVWGAAPAPSGIQTAFIQNTSNIAQTVTLNAGNYTLSFWAAQRACCVAPFVQPIRVSVDGIQIGGLISPASFSFAPFSVPFTVATTGPHTIWFTGTDSNDKTTFIDNVTIQ